MLISIELRPTQADFGDGVGGPPGQWLGGPAWVGCLASLGDPPVGLGKGARGQTHKTPLFLLGWEVSVSAGQLPSPQFVFTTFG